MIGIGEGAGAGQAQRQKGSHGARLPFMGGLSAAAGYLEYEQGVSTLSALCKLDGQRRSPRARALRVQVQRVWRDIVARRATMHHTFCTTV